MNAQGVVLTLLVAAGIAILVWLNGGIGRSLEGAFVAILWLLLLGGVLVLGVWLLTGLA